MIETSALWRANTDPGSDRYEDVYVDYRAGRVVNEPRYLTCPVTPARHCWLLTLCFCCSSVSLWLNGLGVWVYRGVELTWWTDVLSFRPSALRHSVSDEHSQHVFPSFKWIPWTKSLDSEENLSCTVHHPEVPPVHIMKQDQLLPAFDQTTWIWWRPQSCSLYADAALTGLREAEFKAH